MNQLASSVLLLLSMLAQMSFIPATITTTATVPAPVSVQSPQAEAQQTIRFSDYALPLTDYTLPNGLRVILAEDHSAPVVAVDTWFRVGGADDPPQRSGFAHLFEHMMFEGSAHVPNGQWDKLLEAIGANNNAYTQNDKTAFWDVVPSNQLPRILWMESDRMASLAVTDANFQPQRQVVIQEYNQRVANQPFGEANLRLFTQPLQGYAPYELPVIGNVDDLNAATLNEVQDFHDAYYRPNNATLVIVGDIDVAQTQALVQAYYGDIPAGPPVLQTVDRYPYPTAFPATAVDTRTGCQIGTTETLVDAKVKIPRYAISVAGPVRGTPDFYALSLLTDILSSGNSSRFEQDIVRKGLAASAFAGLNDYRGASVLYAAAYVNQGDKVETMRKLLDDEFARVRNGDVTADELARVQQQQLISTITSFRNSVQDTAEWLQDATFTLGDPDSIGQELALYQAVTLADIRRVAQTYLCARPMNVQITRPDGEQTLAADPGELVKPLDVAAAPGIGPATVTISASVIAALPSAVITRTAVPAALGDLQTNLPPFQTFKLDNGLNVIFVEQHETPTVHLNLFVGGSNTAAPADQQGIADLMADLIPKGTETRSADEIAQSIEAVGGAVSSNAGLEWTSLSVDAPTPTATLAYELLGDLVQHATFPQDELAVEKSQTLTFLQQDAVNPTSMANRQFGRIAYGGHPYGYITTPESVKSLTRDDVRKFYETYYKPNNALLVIVGDLSAADAQTMTEDALSSWPAGTVPDFKKYPPATVGDTSVIYLVDRPEAQQATVQIGNRAINARNPDRYALMIDNAVLGGGSSSRLFTNLREDKGYTYGVYSRFAQPNDVGTFRVISDVNQEHVGDAVQEILKELKRMQNQPLTDQELTDAKGMLEGSFALALEKPDDFANLLAARYLTDVPIRELNDYAAKLQSVTAAQAQSAANEYIDAVHPIIVVVGDAKVIEPQLAQIEQVVVVDAAGEIVP
ncbi:MAG: pitrilysin family protein [Caldilineaceae bacterium]